MALVHDWTSVNLLAASGLSGKAVTGIYAYKQGAVDVVEVQYSGGSAFIKFSQGRVEAGGTQAFGSGTEVKHPAPHF